MVKTEEQARELWCPMVRIARREDTGARDETLSVVGGCNTDALGRLRVPHSCRCIASECSMWRWYDGQLHYPQKDPPEPRRGYCGLAGRPAIE